MHVRRRRWLAAWAAAGFLLTTGCGAGGSGSAEASRRADEDEDEDGDGGGGGGGPVQPVTRVLAVNDLGMHCMDREFSVFSILPPYNVVHAQVVRTDVEGRTSLLDGTEVDVRYGAVADATGSINSRSVGKTDFWTWASALYTNGAVLPAGQGLKGLFMPGDAAVPGPQPFAWNATHRFFAAEGIPITPRDDAGTTNTYPLMRISAHDKATGAELAHLDVVVPVADEMDCTSCHRTGGEAADDAGVAWSGASDLEVQTKENVLKLHDHAHGTSLFAARPVLCAACHYSPALDLTGSGPQGAQTTHPWFSRAMHGKHDFLTGNAEASCYKCHPGAETQCARGVMAAAGLECANCHGSMAAVAGTAGNLLAGGSLDGTNDGKPRRSWLDVPRCQSCHTGDALSHRSGADVVLAPDGIRLAQAYVEGDATASAILAPTSRFAENPSTWYRMSTGHGGLLCQTCHGSTHAEWPVATTANDDVAAEQLQAHAGTIRECASCHPGSSLGLTTGGPHGMHNVGSSKWRNGGHEDFYERDPNACRACHGSDLRGSPLARVAVTRPGGFAAGTIVSCTLCHEHPDHDD